MGRPLGAPVGNCLQFMGTCMPVCRSVSPVCVRERVPRKFLSCGGVSGRACGYALNLSMFEGTSKFLRQAILNAWSMHFSAKHSSMCKDVSLLH